ncbi:MAG: serine/threonine protein kinase [Gemmatimonadota bacterium]|nr:serine/threonine protein kinase [Gemmatimonadota bacterium]
MPDDNLQAEVQQALGDHYTLEQELPRGGMSRVFVALENALGRRVVIKVLAPELAASLSAERFKREITLAARLQHPHIVPLLSAGQAGPHLYYTMPFVDGESLRQRMNRERPMAFVDISEIVEQIAGALAYAHGEGIVHRDIKPENVMFFHGQAVVLDFGIGKALISASTTETEAEILHITQVGMSLGTPTYVAPEQATGDPALDHRADLYALGVVAYEMLTGHPPFAGRSPQAVIEAHAKQMPEPIIARRADVPKPLAAIVVRMLAKRPEDRPATGDEIVKALNIAVHTRHSGGGPVIDTLANAPVWIPWTIAAVATAAAIVMSVLYATRV